MPGKHWDSWVSSDPSESWAGGVSSEIVPVKRYDRNFEAGDFSAWSEVDTGNQIVVTTDAARGSLVYGMRFTPTSNAPAYARTGHSLVGETSYRFTWWCRIDSTFDVDPATSPSLNYIFIARTGVGTSRVSALIQSDNKARMLDHFVPGNVGSVNTITRDVWQRYDLWISGDGTPTCNLRLYVDEVLFCELTEQDWSAGADVALIDYGFSVSTPVLNPTGFMDWSNVQLWVPGEAP